MTQASPELPPGLVASILRGDCVAFVGAGFSIPSVPAWPELLVELTGELEVRGHDVEVARQMLQAEPKDAATLELVATMLEREAGDEFEETLAAAIKPPEQLDPLTRARLDTLKRIPFAGVLTTNFDGYLTYDTSGAHDDAASWHAVLRRGGAWYERYRSFDEAVAPDVPVLELHGNVQHATSRVVLTERSYRQRLYADARYLSLMRALLATRTILFLGVSFSDAYVRQLLAETLTLFESTGASEPLAYAILPDVSSHVRAAYREQRGVEVIPYDVVDHSHGAFDDILAELAEQTSPRAALARVVRGRRILWSDCNMHWNAWGVELLKAAGATVVPTSTPEEAIARAEQAARDDAPFDLILTRHGHRDAHARRVLEATGIGRLEVPVIVFASGASATENKRRVIGWGALDYVCDWTALFERIEMLFTDGATSAMVPFRARR